MFIFESFDQIKSAVDRLVDQKKSKNIVRKVWMDKYRRYKVTSSDGKGVYTVYCGIKADDSKKFVSCECQAGLRGRVCVHSVAALSLHINVTKDRMKYSKTENSDVQIDSRVIESNHS